MKRLTHILLLLAAATAAHAQDLSTEITVDRTIVPAERAATRLNSVYPAIATGNPAQVRLDMMEYDGQGQLSRSARILAPAAWADTFALSPYRGYVSGGYFPVYNLGISAGYRIINSADTRLGVRAQFDGYSYHRKDFPAIADKLTFKNNTFSAGADFDRRFGRAGVLTASATYSYGRVAAPTLSCNGDRGISRADAAVNWYGRARSFGYHAGAAIHTFGYSQNCSDDAVPGIMPQGHLFHDKGTELRFVGSAGVVVPFGMRERAQRAGLEFKADMLSRPDGTGIGHSSSLIPENILELAPIKGGTLGIISATPYYAMGSGEGLDLRLGARIDISTGGSGKKFHIAPDVLASWSTSGFSLFARAGGGEVQNTWQSLYDYSPFVPVGMLYQRSHIPVAVDAGVNIGPFAGFGLEIFGGWARANDWLMPSLVDLSRDYTPLFSTVDIKGCHAGARATYAYRSMLRLAASVEFAPQSPTGGYYLWRDRAKMVIKASAKVRPIPRLEIAADYELRTDRGCYSLSPMEPSEFYALGNASLLSASASYELTPALTVFARASNLLGSDHFILPDVPAQGLHGLVGASFKF